MTEKPTITIYHSPDADDAFMFFGMANGSVQNAQINFQHEMNDIESLNHRALRGELEVSAVSVHAFAHLKNRYAILRSGASMGGVDYGPVLVGLKPLDLRDGKTHVLAIPGELTSAALAFRMFLKENGIQAELININFDRVQEAIRDGVVEAGIIIHEGQLTHRREGFVTIQDLGKWWWDQTGLPLPLGINVVRKDLGASAMQAVAAAIKASIDYGLEHRKAAIEYSLSFGRGISYEEADRFISMYVNERTRDIGSDGIKSITLFLTRAAEHGFVPAQVELQFV